MDHIWLQRTKQWTTEDTVKDRRKPIKNAEDRRGLYWKFRKKDANYHSGPLWTLKNKNTIKKINYFLMRGGKAPCIFFVPNDINDVIKKHYGDQFLIKEAKLL